MKPVGAKRLSGSSRRAVVSVLAMMFLVLFGSLAVAMAIVSRGNLRTASTQLHVVRALSAAETGLAVAQKRLELAAARFVIERGDIDQSFGERLWAGTLTVEDWENRGQPASNPGAAAADGRVFVMPNNAGFRESNRPDGILEALQGMFGADENRVTIAGAITSPTVTSAPAGTPAGVFRGDMWLVTPPVAVEATTANGRAAAGVYQITYAPLANGIDVRIMVTGSSEVTEGGSSFLYAADAAGAARPLTRTLSKDFRIAKRHRHAVVSPTRVIIGKNVTVDGPVAAGFRDVQFDSGEPLIMRSDFRGLEAGLDTLLGQFLSAVRTSDTDGDNRLRTRDPAGESSAIPGGTALDQNGQSYSPFADVTGDGYVDDFDIFLNYFDGRDGQRDGRIDLSRVNIGDADLAFAIDNGLADRNANGYGGYADSADNNRVSPTSAMVDGDDRTLGYRDGYIDFRDAYAKVRGTLMYGVTKAQWEAARGAVADDVRGPVVPAPEDGVTPVKFGAADEIPATDVSAFDNTRSRMAAIASGSFAAQVAAQRVGAPPTRWERSPLGTTASTDVYERPVYENMTFSNVTIPMGNNGLFINCTFVGVTRIEVVTDNTHPSWSLYGVLDAARGAWKFPQIDKSDFGHYFDSAVPPPSNYASFPDPPRILGQVRTGAERNTKLYSNNIRFHNCTFVGSVVSDAPRIFTPVRNKVQFTGATRFVDRNPANPTGSFPANPREGDLREIARSSLMLPNFSVDIGGLNAPTDTYGGANAPTPQEVNLKGTIVAGVLDVRGNADIEGSLLTTFQPVRGELPMLQNGQAVGNPAHFNMSLGYAGSESGDEESVDPATFQVLNGVRIAGWDTDGDGLVDVVATPGTPAPAGGVAVPFYGWGRVNVRFNPDLPMPDGIRLPVSVVPITGSYREGREGVTRGS
jgi:hypothetical protein